MVFFALAVSAFTLYDQDGSDAADSITRKGVVYESDGIGSAVVTDFDTRAADVDRDVDILAEVTIVGTKYPVKSIKEGAFKQKEILTVDIPNSVKTIGNEAFLNCNQLTAVTIGNGVTSIGERAFQGCSILSEVSIGMSVTDIGDWQFCQCAIESISIPNSVRTIGSNAFDGCNNLAAVTIGKGVTKIEEWLFFGCSSLRSIDIPDSVRSIGSSAFRNCNDLAEVTFGNGLTIIGPSQFFNCTALRSIVISDSVTEIGNDQFSNCEHLRVLTIGRGVSTIGLLQFSGCPLDTVYYNAAGLDINAKCWPESGDILFIDANGGYVKGDGADGRFPSERPFIPPKDKQFKEYNISEQGTPSGKKMPGDEYGGGKNVYYVLWQDVFTVRFDNNGHGIKPADQKVNSGGLATDPGDLTEEGYIFDGWFREDSFIHLWHFDQDSVTENMMLYAKWTKKEDDNNIVSFLLKPIVLVPLIILIVLIGIGLFIWHRKKKMQEDEESELDSMDDTYEFFYE